MGVGRAILFAGIGLALVYASFIARPGTDFMIVSLLVAGACLYAGYRSVIDTSGKHVPPEGPRVLLDKDQMTGKIVREDRPRPAAEPRAEPGLEIPDPFFANLGPVPTDNEAPPVGKRVVPAAQRPAPPPSDWEPVPIVNDAYGDQSEEGASHGTYADEKYTAMDGAFTITLPLGARVMRDTPTLVLINNHPFEFESVEYFDVAFTYDPDAPPKQEFRFLASWLKDFMLPQRLAGGKRFMCNTIGPVEGNRYPAFYFDGKVEGASRIEHFNGYTRRHFDLRVGTISVIKEKRVFLFVQTQAPELSEWSDEDFYKQSMECLVKKAEESSYGDQA